MRELAVVWSVLVAARPLPCARPWPSRSTAMARTEGQDRILGLDTLYINAMLMLITFVSVPANTVLFRTALIIAMIGIRLVHRVGKISSCARGDRMSHLTDPSAMGGARSAADAYAPRPTLMDRSGSCACPISTRACTPRRSRPGRHHPPLPRVHPLLRRPAEPLGIPRSSHHLLRDGDDARDPDAAWPSDLYRDRFEERQGVPRKQKPAPGEE